ncbi:hypothetical protein SF778_005264, partial [Escherichia coli]|nr:hypothetical protein [Escherichia coli]
MATVARRCEGVGAGARRSQVLHAGPPITWEKMCGAMKGAVTGALVFEGLAKDL